MAYCYYGQKTGNHREAPKSVRNCGQTVTVSDTVTRDEIQELINAEQGTVHLLVITASTLFYLLYHYCCNVNLSQYGVLLSSMCIGFIIYVLIHILGQLLVPLAALLSCHIVTLYLLFGCA